eukprot:gene15026-22937_t
MSEGSSPLRVTVVEKEAGRDWWTGVAYGTPAPWHVINIPAVAMSALEDDSEHLVRWLSKQRASGSIAQEWGVQKMHIPRAMYGAYLKDLVDEQLSQSDGSCSLNKVFGEVVSVTNRPVPVGSAQQGRWVVHLSTGEQLPPADAVIVATGNYEPSDVSFEGSDAFYSLQDKADLPRYVRNPWRLFSDVSATVPKDSRVAIIGTRLTAVDLMLSLVHAEHKGPVHVISRRGLFPFANHGETLSPPPPDDALCGAKLFEKFGVPLAESNATKPKTNGALEGPSPVTDEAVHGVLTTLVSECDAVQARGGVWQSVVDSVRPYFNTFWRAMGTQQRNIFLKEHRDAFEIRRHRVAPGVLEAIEPLKARSTHHIGRLVDMKHAVPADPTTPIVVTVAPSASSSDVLAKPDIFEVDFVINCTGPQLDFRNNAPRGLLAGLIRDGWAQPEETGIGLLVDCESHRLLSKSGPNAGLYAVGPPCKGSMWETIAVKDIREQALLVAKHITTHL